MEWEGWEEISEEGREGGTKEGKRWRDEGRKRGEVGRDNVRGRERAREGERRGRVEKQSERVEGEKVWTVTSLKIYNRSCYVNKQLNRRQKHAPVMKNTKKGTKSQE